MVATARVRFRCGMASSRSLSNSATPLVGTIEFKNRRALLSWLWDPDLYFGETYMFGAADIRGDLAAVLSEIYRALGRETRRSWWLWQRSNDEHAARENVHRHYDLGNAFYQRWLDREMAYTCAYFPTPDATLEDAQIAKMDRVCRKLGLRPGERVLEAGCGWGGLALHMARCYGVTVRAVNVSGEQIAYARDRARAERLEIASNSSRTIIATCAASTTPSSRSGCSSTSARRLPDARRGHRSIADRPRPRSAALHRPEPSEPAESVDPQADFPRRVPADAGGGCDHVLAPWDFSVTDVENLRLHYAATLDHWRARFEAAAGDVGRCSTLRSSGRGGCTSPDRRRRS